MNLYVSNNIALKYHLKQKLLKLQGETDMITKQQDLNASQN